MLFEGLLTARSRQEQEGDQSAQENAQSGLQRDIQI